MKKSPHDFLNEMYKKYNIDPKNIIFSENDKKLLNLLEEYLYEKPKVPDWQNQINKFILLKDKEDDKKRRIEICDKI